MPMMRVHGTTRVLSACGAVIEFLPNIPTYVSPMAVSAFLEQGVELVDEAEKAAATEALVAATSPAPDVIPSGDARTAAIRDAVLAVSRRADPTDFTASGVPKVASVTAITGFAVQSAEITAVYQDVRSQLASEAAADSAAAAAAATVAP